MDDFRSFLGSPAKSCVDSHRLCDFRPKLAQAISILASKMQILVTSCARNAPNSHKRCTTDAKQAVHTSFTKHLGYPRCSLTYFQYVRDINCRKTCHGGGLFRQSYLLAMIYMFTLHVILYLRFSDFVDY